jgi:hypothetical protein
VEQQLLIGIDDTDAGESIGTGALAREVHMLLTRDFDVTSLGVTRHQLLVHPDIPYTSHNSAACLCIEGGECAAVMEAVRELLLHLFHPGADPGLCVGYLEQFSHYVQDYGARAVSTIVTQREANSLAKQAGITLLGLGGTNDGIIGALAACGLRASGQDGRFISLPGIRELPQRVTVAEVLRLTPIDEVVDETGSSVDGAVEFQTLGWVRPDWRGHRIVLALCEKEGSYVVAGRKKAEKDFEK